MMPMPTTSSTSGRPTPITISRAVPPPSGSLGMSPSDWKIRSASGTAVATTSTAADQPPAFGAVGASCIGACGAASATASQRDQAAPRPATRIASGTPNNATRLQSASRMDAAAIGTGEMSASPWLAEIASASAAGAAPRFFGSAPPATARRSGVSSANAVEGEAASPATRPHSAGRRVAPAQRHEPILAASQPAAPVASASPATKPAATITSPGEVIACAKPAPKALPTKAVEKPAASPKAVATTTIARNACSSRAWVSAMRAMREARSRSAWTSGMPDIAVV